MIPLMSDDEIRNSAAPRCPNCEYPLEAGDCCEPDPVRGFWCANCYAFWSDEEIEGQEEQNHATE